MSIVSSGRKLPSHKVEPKYNGYQLIGDNQFLRFSESLLSIKCTKLNGFKFSGLCVKDQKIIDLLRRIHVGFSDVTEKVVLMIGTNDLLCGTSFEAMCEDFKELLKLLSKDAKKIILLTVPPVLQLKNNEYYWNRLKKFNEFIRQCRDDENIFVGDAYAQFVVSKESSNRKSCTSNSNDTNYSSCPKSTPIRFSKWLLTRVANGDKVCRRVMPLPSPSNNLSSQVKRFRTTLPHLPPDQGVKAVQKTIRRRPFPFDANSCLTENRQSPVAKRCCFLPTERGISSCTPFVFNSLKDIIRVPQTHLIGGGDSFLNPSRMPIAPGRRRDPSFCPPSSSGNDDPFTTSSRRLLTPEGKRNSYFNPRLPSSGGDESLTTPLRRAPTPEAKCKLPLFPTPFSDDDSFPTSSKKVLLPKGQDNSFFSPAVSSGVDNSFTTTSRRAVTSLGKCDSLFPPTMPFSGDGDSFLTPSRRVFTFEKKSNSSKADDNHIDSYGKGSTEDEVDIENEDKIRDECFEMYFSGDSRQPDLIHLNIRGLCALRGIIQGIIDIIDENYS